jgi:DNA transformation protein
MSVSDEFLEYVRDQLRDLGDLRVKRMFGGAGLYCGETFFSILVDDRLYLKVDDSSRGDYEVRGLAPFSYSRKDGRVMVMRSYCPVPADVLEDPAALVQWARKALNAASAGASPTLC